MPDGTADFNEVFKAEIAVIRQRRRRGGREPIELARIGRDSTGDWVLGPNEDANLVGLALSGGGVRSAAFCLGAIQAMHETGVLDRVDYLSTVSGGGYIGCSLSACLEQTQGQYFPFETRIPDLPTRDEKARKRKGGAGENKGGFEDETPSVQHIRDHSNYLFPHGAVDVLHNAPIYLRGLVANLVVVMPFLLIAAALTILLNPTVEQLGQSNVPGSLNILDFEHFTIAAHLGLILLLVLVVWGWARSRAAAADSAEVPRPLTKYVGWAAVAVVFLGFCELQPVVLARMFRPDGIGGWLNQTSAALAPIAAIIGFLGSKLGELVKSATESTRMRAQIAGYAARAAMYLASIVVPFLLWVAYLNLSYLGICVGGPYGPYCQVPDWLPSLASLVSKEPGGELHLLVIAAYLSIAALFILLTLRLRPNANSLHPLYRDRLARAFLFKPKHTLPYDGQLECLPIRLSGLSGKHGPYHLINSAINVQSSRTANRRGRNADFFLFSSRYVGSECTGYVKTEEMEEVEGQLGLATALAVSGAAFSSNMGSQSIKPLTPTLAILNIRTGYWLRNPRRVRKDIEFKRRPLKERLRDPRGMRKASPDLLANYYFLLELFGRLNDSRKSVYLSDGGHIDNVGIYELLKRLCRVIIVVDAEADPEMAFGSFNDLVRHARIDLGVEIDLPWQQITNMSRKTAKAVDETGDAEKAKGPHCAIGRVVYPHRKEGHPNERREAVLVYIKSSLTGDENDYVYHYRKRYSAFPHETTLDQMFSEEQFEAYRALGYHAAYGLFDRRDDFAKLDPEEFPQAQKQVSLLDRLFPRATEGGAPGQLQAFTEWFSQEQPEPSR